MTATDNTQLEIMSRFAALNGFVYSVYVLRHSNPNERARALATDYAVYWGRATIADYDAKAPTP